MGDNKLICPHCETIQEETPATSDPGGLGYGLVGCCGVPFAGLILWLLWKDTKPKTAKSVLIGVIVGLVVAWLLFGSIMMFGISKGIIDATKYM